MAYVQDAVTEDMTLRTLLDKVDRAKDVHVKAPLKQAVAAVYAAHQEDKDDLGLPEPSVKSLKGLLKFLAQPYRAQWMPPALALNPEGNFVAVWDVVPNRYSVAFSGVNAADWIGTLRSSDGIHQTNGHYDNFDLWEEPPFPIPRKTV